jgi:hypothetical protein
VTLVRAVGRRQVPALMEFRSSSRSGAWCHYVPTPVSRGRSSASSGQSGGASAGGQGQRLLVVTEPGVATRSRIMSDSGWTTPDDREPWLESAPVHVLVCTRERDYHDRYRSPDKLVDGAEIDWPVPFWFVDAGAALMLLLLGAIDEGLAAGLGHRRAAEKVRQRSGSRTTSRSSPSAIGVPAPDPGWAPSQWRTQRRRAPDGSSLGALVGISGSRTPSGPQAPRPSFRSRRRVHRAAPHD